MPERFVAFDSHCSVLREKVRVHYGEPPQDPFAVNYRQAVLDALLPLAAAKEGHSASSKVQQAARKRRAVLCFFLNDDWQDTDHICCWCPRMGINKEHVLACVERHLLQALLPCKPPMFQRARWTKFREVLRVFRALGPVSWPLAASHAGLSGSHSAFPASCPSSSRPSRGWRRAGCGWCCRRRQC